MSPRRILPAALCFALVALASAGAASAAPVEWKTADGGNGHFYEYTYANADGITWDAARAAAAGRTHAGVQGHLATITSAAEQSFVGGIATNYGPYLYLGASQARDSAAPDQGWSWITGEPWAFTAWGTSPAEPTDGIGFPGSEDNAENYLSISRSLNVPAAWNDVASTVPGSTPGYVVEFAVPEPAAALPLVVAVAALLRRGRRRLART